VQRHGHTVPLLHSSRRPGRLPAVRDIIISSVGSERYRITADVLKPGAAVIDLATRVGTDGKLHASNVIPASATATMDVRPVKGMDPQRTAQRVIDHIRKQGFFVVDQEPSADVRMTHPKVVRVVTSGAQGAIRTPMDLPISQEVIRVVESASGSGG
jgi:acetylornithine deacetylase/succinyl-diaminopimelate desuccinylase-like protein